MEWLAAGTMQKGRDVSERSHGTGTGVSVFSRVSQMEM